MIKRKSEAIWQGKLQSGNGIIKLGSGNQDGRYSFGSRFEQGQGTNPEELIAAAHAGCFSMALAHELEQAGFNPEEVKTVANVYMDKVGDGFKITTVELDTKAKVSDIEENEFLEHAKKVKVNCPVSQALKSLEIKLKAELVK